jgi:hypothetical protein
VNERGVLEMTVPSTEGHALRIERFRFESFFLQIVSERNGSTIF